MIFPKPNELNMPIYAAKHKLHFGKSTQTRVLNTVIDFFIITQIYEQQDFAFSSFFGEGGTSFAGFWLKNPLGFNKNPM